MSEATDGGMESMERAQDLMAKALRAVTDAEQLGAFVCILYKALPDNQIMLRTIHSFSDSEIALVHNVLMLVNTRLDPNKRDPALQGAMEMLRVAAVNIDKAKQTN